MAFATYNFRKEKMTSAIEHMAAEFILRDAPHSPLITVTRSELTQRGRHINIFISVLPESGEEKALEFLSKNKRLFTDYIQEKGNVARMPSFDFVIDKGEKNRRAIEDIL